MNKMELIASIGENAEITKKDAEIFLNSFIDVVTNALVNEESVVLSGFGKFEVRDRAARVGRNPQTGEEIQIDACKKPTFKASKALKEAVNI